MTTQERARAALKQCKGNCAATHHKSGLRHVRGRHSNPSAPAAIWSAGKLGSLDTASKVLRVGGKACVIRAWACDAAEANFAIVIPGRALGAARSD